MGKLLKKPGARRERNGELPTPAQKKQIESLRAFFNQKAATWAKLAPADRRKQIVAWDRVKKGINEARLGYGEVFVD
ncbi:MAG: hypothetical protein WBD40_07210 [Tepidisphaeraceae bacterium]